MYKSKIENATSKGAYGNANDWNAPASIREDDGEVQFPEDVGRLNEKDYIRGYERYYKVDVTEYRTFEAFSGKEELLSEEDFMQYGERPAWIIQGQIITDPDEAGKIYQQLVEMQQKKLHLFPYPSLGLDIRVSNQLP